MENKPFPQIPQWKAFAWFVGWFISESVGSLGSFVCWLCLDYPFKIIGVSWTWKLIIPFLFALDLLYALLPFSAWILTLDGRLSERRLTTIYAIAPIIFILNVVLFRLFFADDTVICGLGYYDLKCFHLR